MATLALLPAPALVAYFVDGAVSWWLMASLSAALGLLTWLSKGFSDSFRDYVITFCYIGHSILFTTSFAGHAWQIDSHMLFVASLAAVAAEVRALAQRTTEGANEVKSLIGTGAGGLRPVG